MGVVVSMQPLPWPQVPVLTARVARASFPQGNLAIRIRDVLGEVYADDRFTEVFATDGRPAVSPGQLMMCVVLQFAENLTDRQAADAVRDRVSWKYALGLQLDDAGFDASVFSEFRSRLVEHQATGAALDLLLDKLVGLALLSSGGRQRTDSTHVLARIRGLNRLELAGETLRAALAALAAAAPGWLAGQIDAGWVTRYGARVDEYRLPPGQAKRAALAVQVGVDGYALLEAVYTAGAPGWLAQLPAVEALRQIWIQQYYRTQVNGRQVVSRREARVDGLPPGRFQLISPYDLDARWGIKRRRGWAGYKVHISQTCQGGVDHDGRDRPNLITNVATTAATVPDSAMTAPIHAQLAGKDLLPERHLVDSGYPSADLLVSSVRQFGVTLVTPLRIDHSTQAKSGGGYDKSAFAIDWDHKQATCPQGAVSTSWSPCRQAGHDIIVVTFPTSACRPCPARPDCTRSASQRRHLSLRPHDIHQAQAAARTTQASDQFKAEYAVRAGVEGTMHQAVAVTGLRHARYLGLDKTRLEHTIAAAAINLTRLDAYLTGKPLDRGRTSHLSRVDLTLAA